MLQCMKSLLCIFLLSINVSCGRNFCFDVYLPNLSTGTYTLLNRRLNISITLSETIIDQVQTYCISHNLDTQYCQYLTSRTHTFLDRYYRKSKSYSQCRSGEDCIVKTSDTVGHRSRSSVQLLPFKLLGIPLRIIGHSINESKHFQLRNNEVPLNAINSFCSTHGLPIEQCELLTKSVFETLRKSPFTSEPLLCTGTDLNVNTGSCLRSSMITSLANSSCDVSTPDSFSFYMGSDEFGHFSDGLLSIYRTLLLSNTVATVAFRSVYLSSAQLQLLHIHLVIGHISSLNKVLQVGFNGGATSLALLYGSCTSRLVLEQVRNWNDIKFSTVYNFEVELLAVIQQIFGHTRFTAHKGMESVSADQRYDAIVFDADSIFNETNDGRINHWKCRLAAAGECDAIVVVSWLTTRLHFIEQFWLALSSDGLVKQIGCYTSESLSPASDISADNDDLSKETLLMPSPESFCIGSLMRSDCPQREAQSDSHRRITDILFDAGLPICEFGFCHIDDNTNINDAKNMIGLLSNSIASDGSLNQLWRRNFTRECSAEGWPMWSSGFAESCCDTYPR